MALKNTTPELFEGTQDKDLLTQDEILMNEDQLLAGLLEAGKYKDNKDNYRTIKICDNGKMLFSFRIRPLSQDEVANCRKRATKYSASKRFGEVKTPVDVDVAKYYSLRIYTATIDEDREKLWDNRKAMEAFGVLDGVDMIDMVLPSGKKEYVDDIIDEISGFGEDLVQEAKN